MCQVKSFGRARWKRGEMCSVHRRRRGACAAICDGEGGRSLAAAERYQAQDAHSMCCEVDDRCEGFVTRMVSCAWGDEDEDEEVV